MDNRHVKKTEEEKEKAKNKPFPRVLRKLLVENNQKQDELAKAIMKSRQSVSLYCNGTEPDLETLVLIANHFNCSVDYLLGVESHPSHDNVSIAEQTGLSEKAISVLKSAKAKVRHNSVGDKCLCILEFASALLSYKELDRLSVSFCDWLTEVARQAGARACKDSTTRNDPIKYMGYTWDWLKASEEQKEAYIESGARHYIIRLFEGFLAEEHRRVISSAEAIDVEDE